MVKPQPAGWPGAPTLALVLATLVIAWPIWFPPAARQPAPPVSSPPTKTP